MVGCGQLPWLHQGYPYIFQPGGTFPPIGGTCGSVLDKDFWWALGKDKKINEINNKVRQPPQEKSTTFKNFVNFLKKITFHKNLPKKNCKNPPSKYCPHLPSLIIAAKSS